MIRTMLMLVVTFSSLSFVQASIADQVPSELSKPAADRIWDGYYKAQVHLRYHSDLANHYSWLDLISRVWMAAVSIGVFATVVYASQIHHLLSSKKRFWLLVAEGAVVIGSIVFLLLDYGNAASLHGNIAHRWEGLANEWDQVRLAREINTEAQLEAKLATLLNEENTIEDSSPVEYDVKGLREAQQEYNHFLGVKPAS